MVSIAFFQLSEARSEQSITLAWDASPAADIAGYKVYYGTESGNFTESIDVGNVTSATVDSLADATTYYFVVRAYNVASLVSDPSNEIAYTTAASALCRLTVNSGSGDGNYSPGTQVVVMADAPPEGQEFDRWDGDKEILSNFLLSPTSATTVSQDVAITALYRQRPGLPPRLLGAVSRKIHGNAGSFDIVIGIAQNAPGGVECRDGRSLNLIATFDKPLAAGQAVVTSGQGAISATPVFSGNSMTIALDSVPNVQILRVALRDLRAADGGVLASATLELRMLLGDVNGDRVVNKKDRDLVQKIQNALLGVSNFRGDLNLSGAVSPLDSGIVVSNQGKAVP